jgi:putative membrane protein
MKRLMQLTAALATAFALTACAGDDARDARDTATGTGGTVAGTSGTIDMDRDFVDEQMAVGNAEVELGRLAQQKATHPDVKEFGATMVREHQMAAEELKAVAAKVNEGAQAPAVERRETGAGADARDEHMELQEELGKLTGNEFDRRYIDEMIDDHQEVVEDLENKAENASHPDVKAWAARTLPKVRQHLEQARSIKETLDRAGNSY